MTWLYLLLAVLILLALAILAVLTHAGLFSDMLMRRVKRPPCVRRVAYRAHKGSYKRCCEAFEAIGACVPRQKLFGIFYDSPCEVSAERCRYIVGCSLADDAEKDKGVEDLLVRKGYKVHTFPECREAIVTEFPYRSQFSLLIAPHLVYKALEKYIKTSKTPLEMKLSIEVYENDFIRYIVPIENSEDFVVPEVLSCEGRDAPSSDKEEDPHLIKKNQ